MAKAITELLEYFGYDVEATHDGSSAIEAACEWRPEFVLLDIGLPGMDGYRVAERLRREESCKNTVVIAVTGYGQEEDRARSCAVGIDHHVVKPVDYDALLSLLSQSS
jgi:CheY-like chemotaxis protein